MTRSPTARSFEYWLHSSRHAWRPALLSSVATPVLYLAALGVGLGALVDRSDPGGLGGVPYLTFVAPGLLAATAMQIAAGEAGQPVRGAFQWTKAYHAMLATPLDVRDVLHGHLLWILFRVVTSCAIYAAVMAAFVVGAFPSWLGKHLVDRPRPTNLQDIPARDDFYGTGYPSGHVTIAVATAAVMVPYLLELPRTRRERRLGRPKHLTREALEAPGWLLASLPFAMAAGVALGRIYVGAHYPLDIVGGALAGLFGAWVVLALPHFQPATPSSIALLPEWTQRLVFQAQGVAATTPVLNRWVPPPVTSQVVVDLRDPTSGLTGHGQPPTGTTAEDGTPR
jgi:membrane-associated phospholipid phosphatase